jgi:hypothetical protein
MGCSLPSPSRRTADHSIRKRLGIGCRRHHNKGGIDARRSNDINIVVCVAVISLLLACAPRLAHAQTRFELRPVETATLSTQQILLGDKNGKSVMLAGEFRIPKPGTDRLPAVNPDA